jgi:predicted ester cyclase
MSEELKAKGLSLVEEYNKHNLNAWDELYANSCVFHHSPYPDIVGLDAYKQYHAGIFAGFPDFKVTIEEMIIEGDTSVTRLICRGTHTGQVPNSPIAPTGKAIVAGDCVVAHYVGGKCVEQWEYIDDLGVMQQLGVIPSM